MIYVFLNHYYILHFVGFYDTFSYLEVTNKFAIENYPIDTRLMFYLPIFFNYFLPVEINSLLLPIIFMSLGFFGIFYFLKRFELDLYEKIFIFSFLSLPATSIFANCYSKEAILIFGLGLFFASIIDHYNNKFNLLAILISIPIVLIFKPEYFPIFIIFFFLCFFNVNKFYNLFFLITSYIVILLFLFYFVEIINYIDLISRNIHFHFTSENSRSNLFDEKYNIFKYLLYGVFVSLKTYDITYPIQLTNFIINLENIIIFISIFFLIILTCINNLNNKKSFYYLFLILIIFIYLVVINYPVSYHNSGSGYRYRTPIILYLFLNLFSTYYISKK